jgi:hypothetical protein
MKDNDNDKGQQWQRRTTTMTKDNNNDKERWWQRAMTMKDDKGRWQWGQSMTEGPGRGQADTKPVPTGKRGVTVSRDVEREPGRRRVHSPLNSYVFSSLFFLTNFTLFLHSVGGHQKWGSDHHHSLVHCRSDYVSPIVSLTLRHSHNFLSLRTSCKQPPLQFNCQSAWLQTCHIIHENNILSMVLNKIKKVCFILIIVLFQLMMSSSVSFILQPTYRSPPPHTNGMWGFICRVRWMHRGTGGLWMQLPTTHCSCGIRPGCSFWLLWGQDFRCPSPLRTSPVRPTTLSQIRFWIGMDSLHGQVHTVLVDFFFFSGLSILYLCILRLPF